VAAVSGLPGETVREALRLLGVDAPAGRSAAQRALRDALLDHGAVRGSLQRAPEGARSAFLRLAMDGPAAVEDLLARGWWGHGTLPPPLDWLQRRGLVAVGDDGLVHAVDEAREGYLGLTPDLSRPSSPRDAPTVRLQTARCVVVAPTPELLDRALTVTGAALQAVAPTVAISEQPRDLVAAALWGAGLRLADETVVAADADAPALPGTAEEAVGPRAVRGVLERALREGRQVRLTYFPSSRGGAATQRVVDPWAFRDDLLRGYCHLRQGERTFAVDRIGRALLLPTPLQHLVE
jgi:hypothetical protein